MSDSFYKECNLILLVLILCISLLNLKQALALRELEKQRNLYSDVLDEFFNPPKPTKEKTKTSISIKFADIEVFVDVEQEDLEGYIIRALAFYKENEKK